MVMAAKVMKLEVNANRYIQEMDSMHVHAPLSTIIDVPSEHENGASGVHRVQVQAKLAVGDHTLRIGSPDGGDTMHVDAEHELDVVQPLAHHFHLAPLGLDCVEVVQHSYVSSGKQEQVVQS